MMAAFLVNMIADGVTFSFGVMFVEFQEEFGRSKAVTAGVVGLFHAVPLLSGPIASYLADWYGCKKVTIVGSVLASVGFLASAFSNSLELLYFTLGIVSGFGLSLCYVAAVVIVAYYFDRRRSFATGISVCGSGVGTFVFAPLTQFLIEEYGWRGACAILAAIFLNMCACGMLYRELPWTRKLKHKKKLKDKLSHHQQQVVVRPSSSAASVSAATSAVESNSYNSLALGGGAATMPEVEELRALIESGDIRSLFTDEELEEYPRLSTSLDHLPTYLAEYMSASHHPPAPWAQNLAVSNAVPPEHLIQGLGGSCEALKALIIQTCQNGAEMVGNDDKAKVRLMFLRTRVNFSNGLDSHFISFLI